MTRYITADKVLRSTGASSCMVWLNQHDWRTLSQKLCNPPINLQECSRCGAWREVQAGKVLREERDDDDNN